MWRHNHKTIIPEYIDITYHITLNKWNSKQNLELEITSIRPYSDIVIINKSNRQYKCAIKNHNEGVIINNRNQELLFPLNYSTNFKSEVIPKDQNYKNCLIAEAKIALGMTA